MGRNRPSSLHVRQRLTPLHLWATVSLLSTPTQQRLTAQPAPKRQSHLWPAPKWQRLTHGLSRATKWRWLTVRAPLWTLKRIPAWGSPRRPEQIKGSDTWVKMLQPGFRSSWDHMGSWGDEYIYFLTLFSFSFFPSFFFYLLLVKIIMASQTKISSHYLSKCLVVSR